MTYRQPHGPPANTNRKAFTMFEFRLTLHETTRIMLALEAQAKAGNAEAADTLATIVVQRNERANGYGQGQGR